MLARFFLILSLGWVASAQAWSDADEARLQALAEELRCLVCQNQSIADSQAPLAEDLRRQTREMIADGRTDDEIRLYMTERYGDFVLYRPPFKATTWVLWLAPFLVLLPGIFLILKFRRRESGSSAVDEEAVDAEKLAEILSQERDRS